MNVKTLTLSLLISLVGMSALAQEAEKRFFVPKAGSLISLMTEEEANEITHLTLTGKINAEDFKHLRNEFKNLEILDLSNADIKMYTGKNGTYPNGVEVYMPNTIPAFAFCSVNGNDTIGKTSLKEVILSDKIKTINEAAFKGCTNLRICQIRRKTAPNLMKDALNDSITAVFVPLGCNGVYREKENWKRFAFVEGDPHEAVIEIGMMGSLEEELLAQGMQPHDINYLTIEGKLDAADFKLMRDYMPNLVGIDLSKTNATSIPAFTFSQKKYLMTVVLPEKLEVIGDRAFSTCKRLSGTIVLPASLKAIEYGAFMGCTNLGYVIATGKNITTLGDKIFENAQLIYR